MTKREVTQLSYSIVGLAIKVHKELGPGLLESIYEKCLKYELEQNGYQVIQQATVPLLYADLELAPELKLDLLVNDTVVVELKVVEALLPVHKSQLLTYMKLLKKPQGLLINFYTDKLTKGLQPFVNDYFSRLPE